MSDIAKQRRFDVRMITAALVIVAMAILCSLAWGRAVAWAQSVTYSPTRGSQGSSGTNGSNGSAATLAVGTVSTLSAGSPATVANVGTSSAAIFNFGLPQGVTGTTGATGAAGSNAIATAVRATTDNTGLYAWNYPAACLNAGHIPALTAIAEGPNPQAGVNANVQIEGVPTGTTASFRVTKTQNTTVALLGLTITVALTGTGIGATVLDLGCSPQ